MHKQTGLSTGLILRLDNSFLMVWFFNQSKINPNMCSDSKVLVRHGLTIIIYMFKCCVICSIKCMILNNRKHLKMFTYSVVVIPCRPYWVFLYFQVQNNLCTPKNGEILVASTQDFLTSSFLITRKDTFYDRSTFSLICSYMGDGMDHIELPTPAIIKVRVLDYKHDTYFNNFLYYANLTNAVVE